MTRENIVNSLKSRDHELVLLRLSMAMKLSLVLLLVQASSLCLSTVLDDYVNAPDATYSYRAIRQPYKGDGFTTYYLNMTSQKWLTGMTLLAVILYTTLIVHLHTHYMFLNVDTM